MMFICIDIVTMYIYIYKTVIYLVTQWSAGKFGSDNTNELLSRLPDIWVRQYYILLSCLQLPLLLLSITHPSTVLASKQCTYRCGSIVL